MEFDKLFKLVVNSKIVTEGDAAEDAKELEDDSLSELSLPAEESPPDSGDIEDPRLFSPEEKIEYLMKHSQLLNNPNWTENDKRAKAEWIVNNDLEDAFIEPIEARLTGLDQEPDAGGLIGVAGDELPVELQDDTAAPEDIEDIVGALDSDLELRKREKEQDEEGLPN